MTFGARECQAAARPFRSLAIALDLSPYRLADAPPGQGGRRQSTKLLPDPVRPLPGTDARAPQIAAIRLIGDDLEAGDVDSGHLVHLAGGLLAGDPPGRRAAGRRRRELPVLVPTARRRQ